MPESRIRRKAAYTAPSARTDAPKVNARWFLPLMLTLFVVGLIWIVVFYLSEGRYPLSSIGGWTVGSWNLIIGFGIVMVGFLMTTRWR